ncbi:hypothetical protein BGZ52_011212 [Haplosporangium bisporale]|nr:hypothetical protein BGZ52_011212 [Haplosporangium bisporale]
MTPDDAPHIQLPIETARLTLDPPSEADDEAMGKMFSDVETMAYLRFKTKEPHGWTKPDIVDRRELQEAGIAKGKVSTYYIHDKRTGELAGVCGANNIHVDERHSDVGIILWKKYWNNGYGTEALYEVMRDLFEERKMHKDELMCPSTNKWVSFYAYVIFEEDWPRIKATLLETMKRGAAKYPQ